MCKVDPRKMNPIYDFLFRRHVDSSKAIHAQFHSLKNRQDMHHVKFKSDLSADLNPEEPFMRKLASAYPCAELPACI